MAVLRQVNVLGRLRRWRRLVALAGCRLGARLSRHAAQRRRRIARRRRERVAEAVEQAAGAGAGVVAALGLGLRLELDHDRRRALGDRLEPDAAGAGSVVPAAPADLGRAGATRLLALAALVASHRGGDRLVPPPPLVRLLQW